VPNSNFIGKTSYVVISDSLAPTNFVQRALVSQMDLTSTPPPPLFPNRTSGSGENAEGGGGGAQDPTLLELSRGLGVRFSLARQNGDNDSQQLCAVCTSELYLIEVGRAQGKETGSHIS
jgi:hypothetical protein